MKALVAIIVGFVLSVMLGKAKDRVSYLTYVLLSVIVILTVAWVLYHLFTMEPPDGSWY